MPQAAVRVVYVLFALASCLAPCLPAAAAPGVYPDRIVFGQSTSLTGPHVSFAGPCATGAQAYFDEVNARGGVHGRKIELLARDDGYDSKVAKENTERLIYADKVFALFGYVGWPGVEAALPIISRARVPFLFPCGGASTLYSGFNRYVFTARASYSHEYRYLLKLFKRFGVNSVMVVYQNNFVGRHLIAEMQAQTELPGLSASWSEVDPDSDFRALSRRIMAVRPDAVLLVNTDPTVNATVLRRMLESGYKGRFFGASFIGQRAMFNALGQFSRGVIITHVVPSPWHVSIPLVSDYRKLMEKRGVTEFSLAGMEGFIGARVLVEGLRRAGPKLTREKLIDALESINEHNFTNRGFPLNFSALNHQGSDFVDAAVISNDAIFLN